MVLGPYLGVWTHTMRGNIALIRGLRNICHREWDGLIHTAGKALAWIKTFGPLDLSYPCYSHISPKIVNLRPIPWGRPTGRNARVVTLIISTSFSRASTSTNLLDRRAGSHGKVLFNGSLNLSSKWTLAIKRKSPEYSRRRLNQFIWLAHDQDHRHGNDLWNGNKGDWLDVQRAVNCRRCDFNWQVLG